MKYSGHRKLLCELSKLNAFILLGYQTNTDAFILVYKFRPEKTGFNMYAEYTQPQLNFLALLPCAGSTLHCSSPNSMYMLYWLGSCNFQNWLGGGLKSNYSLQHLKVGDSFDFSSSRIEESSSACLLLLVCSSCLDIQSSKLLYC